MIKIKFNINVSYRKRISRFFLCLSTDIIRRYVNWFDFFKEVIMCMPKTIIDFFCVCAGYWTQDLVFAKPLSYIPSPETDLYIF